MRLNTLELLLVQAWTALIRNGAISGAAVTNIAVALCVLGAFALTAYNLQLQAQMQASAVEITVDLGKKAKPADVETALKADPRLASVRFVPKAEALKELAQRWQLDLGALQRIGNPLPDSYRLVPTDPNQVDDIAARAQKVPGVAAVRYAQQTTQHLLTLVRGIQIAGLVAILVLGTATLLLVSVTIRLTIYARRHEIRIMQLVGATNWFIRLPFLLEGIFQGALGGLIAAVLLVPGYSYLQNLVEKNLPFLRLTNSPQLTVLLVVGVIVLGLTFGALGSLIGLQRHLQEV
ncbi:MAG TPA: permease-like cell division protein FtsX [Armatimonadota bacterium]|jgi:cell division transport system permease protein